MSHFASVRVMFGLVAVAIGSVLTVKTGRADQVVLTDGLSGDGHMAIRGDQYGAFGSFSVGDAGYAKFDPDGPVGLKDWQFWSGLMLADDFTYLWLMDEDDWPGDFGTRLPDSNVLSDTATSSMRTSSFELPDFGDLEVDLVQETPPSGYNFVQTYTFRNVGNSPLSLKLVWMDDQDIEFAQTWQENLVGFVEGDEPRVYFIEDSDVAGPGDPGVGDRDRRISIEAQMTGDITFDGSLVGRTPLGSGGATHLHFWIQNNLGIDEEFLDTVQEITPNSGMPAGSVDDDGDNLLDEPGDTSGSMQFSLDLPASGSATLTLDYIGGSLSNGVSPSEPQLQAGDADQDLDFDQFDLVRVQQSAKYLTDEPATWGEGDWDGAPGGKVGEPPLGDGKFDQLDVIAALSNNLYLEGKYAALAKSTPESEGRGDGQTSVGYNAATGEVFVDAPAGVDLTSINIDSEARIFTGDRPQNLDGNFDTNSVANIFKATFGSSFGSLSFGNVAQTGLSEQFVLDDLSVIGSLGVGGGLGDVDLIYIAIPEPSALLLLGLGLVGVLMSRESRRTKTVAEASGNR